MEGEAVDPTGHDVETPAAQPRAIARTRRRPFVLTARIALSALMLGILLRRMPHFRFDSLLPDWNRDTAMFLALAFLFTLVGIILSVLRWRAVLSALGQEAKLGHLLSHTLAGLFV